MSDSKKNANDVSLKKVKKSKKNFFLIIAGTVIIGIILILVVFGVGIYRYNWQNRPTQIVTSIIPYPAAIVNWSHFITVNEFTDEVESIVNYRRKSPNNIDLTDEYKNELSKQVLDLMIENEIVKEQAKKYNLKVTSSEIYEEYNKTAEENGGEQEFKNSLKDYYNWTPEKYKEIIEIILLKEKLEEAIAKDDEMNKGAKEKAEGVLKDLEGGADFVGLAKNFSDDGSAVNGGDLGFTPKDSGLPSELEDAAFSLEEGQISKIIKTKFGYNIIKLEEKKDDQVHIRLILIHPVDFQNWLSEKKSQAKIFRFLAK